MHRLLVWRRSSAVQQPAERAHQLVDLLLGVAGRAALALHAVTGVIVDQAEGDLVQCGLDRRDLGQDVNAVALVLDHPGHAAHLPLDPRETLEQLLLRGGIATARCGRGGLWFRHDLAVYPRWV